MTNNNRLELHEDMVFKLSNRSPADVKLKSLEWAIITQVDGEKTVAQIGEALSLTGEEVNHMFKRLRKEELIELIHSPENDQRVPGDVFDELEYQFTFFVGPIAGIILDDLLAEFNRNRDTLQLQQLPLFIELVGLEISNPDKRYEFQKAMLHKIKDLF